MQNTALTLLGTEIGFDGSDTVTVVSNEKLGLGFSVPEIIALSNGGFEVIDKHLSSPSVPTSLGAAQAKALAESMLSFASDDGVTIVDDGGDIARLSADHLAKLSTKGVDGIDAWDDLLTLSF